MATLTPSSSTGDSNTGYSVAEFWQALANAHASYYWAGPSTTWSSSGDSLTITGTVPFDFFVDPVKGDIRESRKKSLRQLPRPSGKRYMTATVTSPDTVVLTLSDTRTSLSGTGAATDAAPELFGVLGESF